MKTVKINRLNLLAKVKENREKHIAEYKEAREGFVAEAIVELKKMLRDAKNGKVKRAVDLDHNEFEQYVRDNWQWKTTFNITASLYNSKVA
jgi:hypothetical protein